MKHRTPKINPTKSKNINVEYGDKQTKILTPKKQHTFHTKKKNAKQHTYLYKPRQALTAQTTHTKGALCEKQHNTVLKSKKKPLIGVV